MNKKVIFLIPTLSMGGGERVVSDLSLGLPDSIEKIIVLFKNEVFYPYKGKMISLDMSLSNGFLFKIYYFLKGFFLFKKIVRKENPDYIITFGFPSDLMGILTSPSKTLVGAHSLWSKSHGGIIEEKIKIIYNPVNVEKIREQADFPIEPEYGEIFKNPVIITMGRLSIEKNYESLIKSFKEIKNEIKTAKLVILGAGENKEFLEQLIKELGFEDSVYLLGRQDNPFRFLAKAKVFVLASLREGLPCSILEAMACGIPIISTDCKSGPREILAPETDINYQTKDIEYAEFGILTPVDFFADSQEKLTKAVINVLTDKKLSNNLIEKSKQRAKDFNINNIIKEWKFLENNATI